MNFRKNSLTRSFIQRAAVIFILLIGLVALFYRWGFPTYYYWKMEQPVKEAQKAIQQGNKPTAAADLVIIKLSNDLDSEEQLTNDFSFHLNREGISLNRFWVDRTTIQGVKSGRAVQRLYNQTKQKSDFYTVFFNQADTIYLIGRSIPDFKAAIHTLFPIIMVITVFFLLLIFGLVTLLVRNQIIKPVSRLEQSTRNIAKLDFAASDTYEENELGSLSQSINRMKQALQQHEKDLLERNERLKNFSSNLAHELKTPLSVMQLLVDGEEMRLENPTFLHDLDQQISEMNNLVASILSYSQQSREEVPLQPLEIQELLKKEIQQQHIIAPDFSIESDVEACLLQTNESTLKMILLNLLTNGMKYSQENYLQINGRKEAGFYRLAFENKAKKLSEQQFSQLIQPFVVGEESRNNRLSGTGLGLSIVNEAVKTLGGSLLLEQKEGGFIATILLPT